MPFLTIGRLWVWISALASVAGWCLSSIGQLNEWGYIMFVALAAAGWLVIGRKRGDDHTSRGWRSYVAQFKKIAHRQSRFFPALFTVLCVLIFFTGLAYPPTNHAGLTYRTPRVLQWLSEQNWFWIHTPSYRMNNRTCGFEWLSAPLILFLRSDRPLFLLNLIPYVLLPGFIYSVFTRVGLRRKVAWHWMWLLPTGYCFLLQAGSIANDAFPTVYAFAAIDFALRARRNGSAGDFALSCVAAAMLTGAKVGNLPLLLPWGMIVLGALPRVWGQLASSSVLCKVKSGLCVAGVGVVCLLCSFVPTALLNTKFCGDWTGLSLERAGMNMKNPAVGLWGNSFLFALHNFAPPLLPQAKRWNETAPAAIPGFVVEPMNANFEAGYHLLWELPTEDWAGLGFGISVLLVGSLGWAVLARKRVCLGRKACLRALPKWLFAGVLAGPWIALAIYSMKSGMVTGARIIAPYYPFLAMALLSHSGHEALVRKRLWKGVAIMMALMAVPILAVNPPRPLWPAQTLLARLAAAKPDSRLLDRARRVYTVYGARSDPLASVRDALPRDAGIVGFMADGDDMDISLWRPFFSRKVRHILWSDTRESLHARGIEWVVVGGAYLKYLERGTDEINGSDPALLREWLTKVDGEVISKHTATLKVNEGPQPWYVVKLRQDKAD